MTRDDEEILDLVNIHDEVVGKITRSEAMVKSNLKGNYLRGSNVFLVNPDGKIWIPRRTLHKTIAPGGLDYSAGEHVETGEDYLHAIVRGMQEELVLDVLPSDLKYIGTIPPREDMPPYFNAYFVYQTSSTPQYNPEDFQSAEWVTHEELLSRLEQGEPAKKTLLDGIKLYASQLA